MGVVTIYSIDQTGALVVFTLRLPGKPGCGITLDIGDARFPYSHRETLKNCFCVLDTSFPRPYFALLNIYQEYC